MASTLRSHRNEVLGLVGESGSGKTSLAWAIMRHLPRNAREIAGHIHLGATDLRAAGPRALTALRGQPHQHGVPGPVHRAEPDPDHRTPGDRGADRASWPDRCCRLGRSHRSTAPRPSARARAIDAPLSAPNLRRREATRGDRHGVRLPAGADHLRRADQRAGCHYRRPHPGAVRRVAAADGRGRAVHLARPGAGIARRRSRRHAAGRQDRRRSRRRYDVPRAASRLHAPAGGRRAAPGTTPGVRLTRRRLAAAGRKNRGALCAPPPVPRCPAAGDTRCRIYHQAGRNPWRRRRIRFRQVIAGTRADAGWRHSGAASNSPAA